MSPCPDKILLLHGLVDGELDAANALTAEAHLKACEGCSAELQRLQALQAQLRTPGVAYAAPEGLRGRIDAALAAGTGPATASRPPRRRAAPWLAGGTIGALAAGLAIMAATPQMLQGGLDRQLVASHVRSLLADHLTDVATSNQHVVRPWFNGKVDVAPPVPELADQGFPLVGGRLDYIDGRVTPAIVYKRRLHTVNLFVWPAEGQGLAPGRTARRDGYSLVEWTAGGLRFAAVSDIDMADLQQFRAAYAARSPP
jgi:anti-sigma factor RsiW